MRILIVSTTAIGDTIMATPFIRAVQKKYPDAHITFFADRRRIGLLDHNPHIHHFIVYHGKGRRLFRTLLALRRGKFDMALVLHANDPDIVPMVRWTGAPIRIGWGESKWSHLFTHTIHRTQPPEHFLVHKKRLVESMGIPVEDLHTEIHLHPMDEIPYTTHLVPWLHETGCENGFVIMHTFGTNPKKWWPLENFFKMSDHIMKQHHWPTIFVGDPQALDLVTRHPKFDHRHHFSADHCTLRESAAIIHHAKAMLTTDSGPMHMAHAVQCPTLALFGPTQASIHGPCFDLHLHQAIQCESLTQLSVDEVTKKWDAFAKKIKSSGKSGSAVLKPR